LNSRDKVWIIDISDEDSDNADDDGDDDALAKRRRNVLRSKHNIRYVFFDAECAQSRRLTLASGSIAHKHECLLIVAEVLCVACLEMGITTDEEDDGRMAPDCVCGLWRIEHPRRYGQGMEKQYRYSRRLLFENFQDASVDPVWLFCKYLMMSMPQMKTRTIAISHNGGKYILLYIKVKNLFLGKYDMHLCLEAFYAHNVAVKQMIRGMKLYQLKVRHTNNHLVIFKDSLNFFLFSLASLRTAYHVEEECEDKPHFLHLYTRRENLPIERLTLPDLEFYDVGRMMEKEARRTLRGITKTTTQNGTWHASSSPTA